MNTNGITKFAKTIGGFVSENSPTILTSIAVTGVIATTVMGGKDTIKAYKILEDEKYARERDAIDNCSEEVNPITTKEVVQLTWKCYIPTAVMGLVTIGCVVGANSINSRRNTVLASLYSLSEKAMKEYQSKVVEKIGEEKHREIKDDIARERIERNPVSSSEVIIGRGETLCYDMLSGRYFWSDMESIKAAINKINVRMRTDMFVPLNDIYYELDLEGTKTGELLGWYIDDGAFDPEFSSQLSEDGRPCLVLDFSVEPRYLKRDY